MPYESLDMSPREVNICNVQLDPNTGAWVYEVKIRKVTWNGRHSFYHEYSVQRRFSEFKKVYEAVRKVMDQHVDLPECGVWSLIRADNEEFIQKRMQGLNAMLQAVEADTKASRVSEYCDFLGCASHFSKLLGSSYMMMGAQEKRRHSCSVDFKYYDTRKDLTNVAFNNNTMAA